MPFLNTKNLWLRLLPRASFLASFFILPTCLWADAERIFYLTFRISTDISSPTAADGDPRWSWNQPERFDPYRFGSVSGHPGPGASKRTIRNRRAKRDPVSRPMATSTTIQSGWVRVSCRRKYRTGCGSSIFTYRANGVTVQTGCGRLLPDGTRSSADGELSGTIRTGLAVANPSGVPLTVTISFGGRVASLDIPANGNEPSS